MKSTLPLSLLLLETSSVLAAKVLQFPVTRRKALPGESLRKRASTVSVSLGNEQVLYIAQVSVGTPSQTLQLQFDTGSSDVWMTDSGASYCSQGYDNCEGGTFNPSKSSTYKEISGSDFNITYVDGSGSTGTYFTDDFSIGGVTVSDLQMGLATQTTIGTGIIGVCFEADESICSEIYPCPEYPSIVSQLVSQGYINSEAYSLWLDDMDAKTGSILFGGIDTAKFEGSLVTIPIQRDADSGGYTSFSVAFTGLTVDDGSSTNTLTDSSFAEPAILDSGTSLMLLPDSLFQTLTSTISGLEYNSQAGVYIAPCSSSSSSTTYNFQFGGSSGPVISVASSEFFESVQGLQTSSGEEGCEFGILPAGSDPILFGDTFLRSAYVVYDLDNKQISLAQSNFNAGSSNIVEIQAGEGGVPSVTATASGVSVTQTGTVNSYGVDGATATATGTSAAVPGVRAPGADGGFAGVVVMGVAGMAAVLGSCFVFL